MGTTQMRRHQLERPDREMTNLLAQYATLASVWEEETPEMLRLRGLLYEGGVSTLRILAQQFALGRKWQHTVEYRLGEIINDLLRREIVIADLTLDTELRQEVLANIVAALAYSPERMADLRISTLLLESLLRIDKFIGRDHLVCQIWHDVQSGQTAPEYESLLVLLLDKLAMQ